MFDKKLLIMGQVIIGGVIIIGSIASCFLTINQANIKNGQFRVTLQIETGCLLLLLVLNEYLSISALQPRLTHILAALFFVGTLVTLLLSTYSQKHRNILLSSFMIVSLASLSFVHVQFIRFWTICVKPRHIDTNAFKLFWRHPGHTAPKHQRALWVASVGSIGLFILLLGVTILACARPCLWTQLTTIQVSIICLRKVAVSIYLLRAPECHTVMVEV